MNYWCWKAGRQLIANTIFNASLLETSIVRRIGGSNSEASAYNADDLGSIPGSGRSPGEGNGYLLQYSHLDNIMDGGASWAIVYRLDTTEPLHFIINA